MVYLWTGSGWRVGRWRVDECGSVERVKQQWHELLPHPLPTLPPSSHCLPLLTLPHAPSSPLSHPLPTEEDADRGGGGQWEEGAGSGGLLVWQGPAPGAGQSSDTPAPAHKASQTKGGRRGDGHCSLPPPPGDRACLALPPQPGGRACLAFIHNQGARHVLHSIEMPGHTILVTHLNYTCLCILPQCRDCASTLRFTVGGRAR